jgi:hypothetical protein
MSEDTTTIEKTPTAEAPSNGEASSTAEAPSIDEKDAVGDGTTTVEGKSATPVEGEPAAEGEAPVEGEPAVEGEAPVEGEPAAEGEAPVEGEPAAEKPPERELTDEEKASIEKTGAHISDTLGETHRGPRLQINQIVGILGEEQSMALLAEVQEIEANGGIMLPDNSRRRTPGGVFFHFAYHRIPPERRRGVYRYKHQRRPWDTDAPIPWTGRGELITFARKHGKTKEVKTVKITIVGALGKTVEKTGFTLAMVKNTPNLNKLPRGIPRPEASETTYVIYIGSKQWQKVKHALKNPEDAAIIEGTPMWDEEYQAMAVFATSITTKLIQQARREEQKAQAAKAKEQEQAGQEQPGQEAVPEPVAPEQATPEAASVPVAPEQATPEAASVPVAPEQATPEAAPEPVAPEQATPEAAPEPVAPEQATPEAAPEPATEKKPSSSHSPSKKQKPGTRVSRNKKK